MDILIVDYFPQLSDLIPWLPGEAQAAMIIMLPTDGQYDDATVLSLAPQSVLQNPISNRLMLTTVKTAWSQFRYEQRLLNRVERLDENVRSLRDVERAKLIIMTKHNLDEDAAYRHLRETAMSQQQSVSSVATNIVQSAQGTH